MESHPDVRDCVVHCVHCGICFLTHPRNAGRRNLRCPFGCRRHHRRELANHRSAAYYGTAAGKQKKERLNAARHRRTGSAHRELVGDGAANDLPPPNSTPEHPLEEPSMTAELPLEGVVLDESSVAKSRMLPYLRMVVGLIEGIHLSLNELIDLLRQALRQRSIAPCRRVDYVLAFLHQHPP